jgi:flagellar hook-associated protein 1 FlgK
MANLINTAISGLKLSQLALSITGQNIVNANTEGYSRQSITAVTSTAQKTGVGYVGTGVTVTDIFRNTQQYLVDQVGRDISVLSGFDTYLSNISQTDNMLANPNSSLATSMENYFGALNEAANDPASLLGRQLILTQTLLLTDSFRNIESTLKNQNTSINTQFDTLASSVTGIAKDIASLNEAIGKTMSVSGAQQPNDLLDKRDQLVRDLSAFMDVKVTQQNNQTIDVFVAQGQALVLGSAARQVLSVAGTAETNQRELVFVAGTTTRVITDEVTGGEIGGLARFRREALDPALSALGRIALAVADGVNQQQKLGIDLEGNLGGPIFTDINAAKLANNRVRSDSNNRQPDDRQLSVNIDDVSKLKLSDYKLNFGGPGKQYTLIRESDGKLMAEGVLSEKLPVNISVDGFTLTLKSGTFQSGDKFSVMPTKTGASDIKVVMMRPEGFAFASPIRTQSGAGNSGGAFIQPGTVLDINTPSFTSKPGELSPPVMIRFTSATTYDVLDYSDPANPIALKPPLNNQKFSPGATNQIFPSDPGGTTVSMLGSGAGRINNGDIRNGYAQEMLTFVTTDPVTGYTSEQRLMIEQNQPAYDIAQRLSNLPGVKANASSQLQLSDFKSDNVGAALTVTLNGVDLTDPNIINEGEVTPQALPDPLTADFLRDRINTNTTLTGLGISATSDGVILTVRSGTGVDLKVNVGGNAGDSLSVRDGDLRTVVGSKALTYGATIGASTGFNIDVGFGSKSVSLTPGTLASSEVAAAVQADIDAALGKDVVNVTLNAQGKLEIRSVGDARAVKISNTTGGDPLGLALTRIIGPDQGAVTAQLANGASASAAYDFSGTNASFLLVVDGSYAANITLNQNYAADSGSSIVSAIQTQINNSTGATGIAGRLTVAIDANGALRFTTTTTGEQSIVSIAANASTQGLVKTATALGKNTGGENAALVGNVSLANGFNFDSGGPHTFNLQVDGNNPVAVTLTGTVTSAAGVADNIRTAINTALAAQGIASIRVGVSTDGFLTLDSNTYGANSQLAVTDVVGTFGTLFAREDKGVAFTNDFVIGGTVDVQLAANMSLSSDRREGLFGREPKAMANFMGYQISIGSGQGTNGAPQAGDTFVVSYNTDGSADNRNGAAMLALNSSLTLSDGNLTYQGAYGQLVENLGILTSQARLSQAASETLLRQSMDSLQGVSGVNIEEEAARLIQFEQHYNASARLITLAKDMFDTLVSI